MRGFLYLICLIAIAALPASAQVCGRNDVQGSYGFQFSGATSIGANGTQPMVGIGHLVFDGAGVVSGVSSVNLDGYFLGNPVTGSYQFKENCSLTFQLQDDSGAFQHFRGIAKEGGASVEIHQTDSDTGQGGVLERTPAAGCSSASLHGDYMLTLSGTASQFATDQSPGAAFSLKAAVNADGAGNLAVVSGGVNTTGSYTLDSDCVAEMELGVTIGNSASILKLRGVLVQKGKLVLAVESDPARIAAVRLTAKP
jgi:hypothetical protein